MLAVAVALEKVPVDAELFTDVGLAKGGISLTVNTVPTGILLAVNVTGTGFVVPFGKETSADVKEPPGFGGEVSPPTELIVRIGKSINDGVLLAVIGPGVSTRDAGGLVARMLPVTNASMRIRPSVPPPLHKADPPDLSARMFPVFVISGATKRMAPPLPPPATPSQPLC
jgi:hypothetical protein